MIYKVKIFTIVFTVMVILVLSGCEPKSNIAYYEPNFDFENPPKISGKIKVTYCASSDEEVESMTNFIASYKEKYKNVDVTTEHNVQDIEAKLFAGDVGDVFWLAEENTYRYAIERNTLLPLDAYIDVLDIDISDVYSGVYNLGKVKDKLFMVPRDYDHIVLFMNVDAVNEAELELPKDGWSWEDFKNYAPFLTKKNQNGQFTQVACYLQLNYDPIYTAFLEGWGGKWVDVTNKRVNLISDKNVLKGITEMIQAAEAGYLYPTGASGALAEKYNNIENKNYVFRQLIYPHLFDFANEFDRLGIEWDIISFPHFPSPSVGAGASGYGVYKKSKNKDTAAAFALYFLTEEGQIAYHSNSGGSVPILSSLSKDSIWRTNNEKWIDKNFDAFVSFPEYDIVGQVQCRMPISLANLLDGELWNNMLIQHFAGAKNYLDSLEEMETIINKKWSINP